MGSRRNISRRGEAELRPPFAAGPQTWSFWKSDRKLQSHRSICQCLEDVSDTLTPCFRRQRILKRGCGSFNLLGELFGHRPCHQPSQCVSHYNPLTPPSGLLRAVKRPNLMASRMTCGTRATTNKEPTRVKSSESTSLSTVGRGGRKSFLTDLEPHHRVPCANTSETPSVPTQIVQQVRLAGLPGSTLPWELVVSALDQKVLSMWPMCADSSPTCTRDMARAALLASSSSSCARRLRRTDCV